MSFIGCSASHDHRTTKPARQRSEARDAAIDSGPAREERGNDAGPAATAEPAADGGGGTSVALVDASAASAPMQSDAHAEASSGSTVMQPSAAAVSAEPQDDARHVFDQTTLREYNFVIAEQDLATIDKQPTAEQYVNGMVEVDGETYGPVGIRYKGSVGGFRPPCTATGRTGMPGPKTGKCSMKVDFDRVDPELRFHGLKKLNFHSMDRDQSMLRDRLGYAMYREFGIAASRATHARLSINGKLEGLYVVVEQVDGRFTHSRFEEDGDGNLYKEIWPTPDKTAARYVAALETNEDDNPSADKMLRFATAISQSAADSFKWLDEHYTYDYIAVDRVITNDDGAFHWYCTSNHNYYWYEAQHMDRMWLVPWDLDSSFQNPSGTTVHIATPWNETAQCTCGQARQMPASCDRLTGEWASQQAKYESSVDAFLAGPFAAANVEGKLMSWIAQIDPMVQEASGLHGAPTYDAWQQAVTELQKIIASSREHRGYDYSQPWQPSAPMTPPESESSL